MNSEKTEPTKMFLQRKWRILVIFLVVTVIGVLIWQLLDARNEIRQLNNNPEQASQQISDGTVDKVGQLIVLPEGETPRVAKVSELGKLPSSPLFANVQQEDVVLIYDKAKRVIIYRPSENKIVEVATYTSDSPTDN